MSQNFKPPGYNSVSPYFVVDGAEKLIALLVKIFEAEELRKYEDPDGRIIHAEIKIDDSVLMFGNSSERYPPNKLLIHVYVPDVDATFQKAIEMGCEPVEKPTEREGDHDGRGSFRDFAGNEWSVSTQVNQ